MDKAAAVYRWDEEEKRYLIEAKLALRPLEHLSIHPPHEVRTYEQACAVLLEHYGSGMTAEAVRQAFPHSKQEARESSEDFLDRLLRDFKRVFLEVALIETRDLEVLNVLYHGLRDEKLGETLELEYEYSNSQTLLSHQPTAGVRDQGLPKQA